MGESYLATTKFLGVGKKSEVFETRQNCSEGKIYIMMFIVATLC